MQRPAPTSGPVTNANKGRPYGIAQAPMTGRTTRQLRHPGRGGRR